MPDDWFRRTTWSEQDQREFFARLKRARATSRAQYLRIQAAHFQEAGTPELLRAAVDLLDVLIVEMPERTELATAHWLRARCLATLGRHTDALAAYRDSFAAERDFPNFRTNAYLDFGELVVALKRIDFHEEVLSVFEEFGGDEGFPSQQYQYFAVHALISEERGDVAKCKDYARQALAAAAKTESAFGRHRKLGLVKEQRPDVEARLRRLAFGD